MNPIYDETYMGEYRTPFNTILERGVRICKGDDAIARNRTQSHAIPHLPHAIPHLPHAIPHLPHAILILTFRLSFVIPRSSSPPYSSSHPSFAHLLPLHSLGTPPNIPILYGLHYPLFILNIY